MVKHFLVEWCDWSDRNFVHLFQKFQTTNSNHGRENTKIEKENTKIQ